MPSQKSKFWYSSLFIWISCGLLLANLARFLFYYLNPAILALRLYFVNFVLAFDQELGEENCLDPREAESALAGTAQGEGELVQCVK